MGINKINYFILSVLLLAGISWGCSPSAPDSGGQTYYVDNGSGNDKNSGTAPGQAWASLEKVNQMTFKPGDRLLFKAGTAYRGQLKPRGSGTQDHSILINTYSEGDKPAIHGEGKYKAAVLLENIEYWEVRNLEITNKGPKRKAGRRGLIVRARNFGDCHHIILDSLVIHDVNGSLVKQEGGGSAIYWRNEGDSIKTRFVDLVIKNSHFYKCERNGINSWGYVHRDEWHPSIGVVIRNNLLEQIPGDGIVPIGCHGALIEHNVMRDCPDILPEQKDAAAGIWPWSSDSTIIQFNEVSGHKAKIDGQGFDADWNCRNTIIQYNYSHDNYGGFLLICNNGNNVGSSINIGNQGTIIRYNVSVNDGLRPYHTRRKGLMLSPTIHMLGPVKNARIYNNVFIIKEKPQQQIDNSFLEIGPWGDKWPDSTQIANNIIFTEEETDIVWGKSTNNRMSKNLIKGKIENLIDRQRNLLAEKPGWKDLDAVGKHRESLKNLKLQPESPCINQGVNMSGHTVEDFFGNPVTPENRPDIGIHELK